MNIYISRYECAKEPGNISFFFISSLNGTMGYIYSINNTKL